jgi:putative intracellular protease/amidase
VISAGAPTQRIRFESGTGRPPDKCCQSENQRDIVRDFGSTNWQDTIGQPPLDPKSNEPNFQTDLTRRFEADAAAKAQLASTVRLDSVKADDYDTVFYPGGHGPMWDLAEDPNSIKLIGSFLAAGKPIALVCHAPGALRHVKTADGKPLVEGKNVTGFTNSEEEAVGLTKVVPFLVEDELKAKGGHFSKTGEWGVHVVSDGLLITGQNPASSGPAAKVLLDRLAKPGKC